MKKKCMYPISKPDAIKLNLLVQLKMTECNDWL